VKRLLKSRPTSLRGRMSVGLSGNCHGYQLASTCRCSSSRHTHSCHRPQSFHLCATCPSLISSISPAPVSRHLRLSPKSSANVSLLGVPLATKPTITKNSASRPATIVTTAQLTVMPFLTSRPSSRCPRITPSSSKRSTALSTMISMVARSTRPILLAPPALLRTA